MNMDRSNKHAPHRWRIFIALLASSLLSIDGTQLVAAAPTPQQAAIQETISRANVLQVQALAGGNPAVMAETATPEYLEELTQINEDLVANGVASIALVNIRWGAIVVIDTTAAAT